MDSLMTTITQVINHNMSITNLILFLVGFFVPIFVGMALPRKKTIGYGRILYRFLGTFLAQKRVHIIPNSLWQSLITILRSTFVDMSYGVYIESRVDLSKEEKEKKIIEYLDLTLIKKSTEPEQPKG